MELKIAAPLYDFEDEVIVFTEDMAARTGLDITPSDNSRSRRFKLLISAVLNEIKMCADAASTAGDHATDRLLLQALAHFTAAEKFATPVMNRHGNTPAPETVLTGFVGTGR